MEVINLGSGSSGNCYIISNGDKNVLIEAGVSREKALNRNHGFLPSIDLIVISHEHQDHAKYIKSWIDRTSCPILASKGTIKGIKDRWCLLPEYRCICSKTGVFLDINGISVAMFDVNHDANEPTGFVINVNGQKCLYVTDTFKVNYRFKGINTFLVEANYSRELLEEWYTSSKSGRIVGRRLSRAHFEVRDSIDFVSKSLDSSTESVYLIHISTNDGDPDLFLDMFQKEIPVPIYVCNRYGGIK